MEPEQKSLETPSAQASDEFVFGIVLGSDLQAHAKNVKIVVSFGNETTTNTDGLIGGSSLSTTVTISSVLKPATRTELGSRPGGLEGVQDAVMSKTRGVFCCHATNSLSNAGSSSSVLKPAAGVGFNPTPGGFAGFQGFGSATTSDTVGLVGGNSMSSAGTSSSLLKPATGTEFSSKPALFTGFKGFQYETASHTDGLSSGNKLNNAGSNSSFSKPAAGIGFTSTPGGFAGSGFSTAQTSGMLFGTSTGKTSHTFGQVFATNQVAISSLVKIPDGTAVSFRPVCGEDTMMISGKTTNIKTKHQCITAMREYENKSLEELRMEDYRENRISKQKGASYRGL